MSNTRLHEEKTIRVLVADPIPVDRLGYRKLSRAHLRLAERTGFTSQLSSALAKVETVLGEQLGAKVSMSASLLPASLFPFRSIGMGTAFALVDLSAVGAYALLEVDLPLLSALLSRVAGGSSNLTVATELTRIEEAAFGFVVLRVLGALRGHAFLERQLAPRLSLLGLDREEMLQRLDRAAPHVGVDLAVELDGVTGSARLLVPAHPLQGVLDALPVDEPSELAPEVLAAALPVRVLAGRTTLEAPELEALGPGDVVLCDGLVIREGRLRGPTRLQGSGFHCRGMTTDQGLQIERVMPLTLPSELTMLHSPDSAASIPVDVEIELASVRLTLAELSRLKPGNVIPLHINVAEPVLLKVGERAVARAELVDVEGEVGARILSLLP